MQQGLSWHVCNHSNNNIVSSCSENKEVDNGDVMQAAGEMLAEAVEEVESDGKMALAGDLFRQAIGAPL